MADLQPKDLRIDTFRPPGSGGWSTLVECVVRITHIPSGIEITESEDRSVHRNRVEAMRKMQVAWDLCPEAFVPVPAITQHAELKSAWDTYRGDAELSIDDAFLFAAGFIAGRGLRK